MLLLTLLIACAATPEPPATATPAPAPVDQPDYDEVLEALEADRRALSVQFEAAASDAERRAVLQQARALAFAALRDGLFPHWFGTTWAFHGTSETPGEGTIACGYFVSTTLRDAGFDVERIPLAQQPSENIVKTFAEPQAIRRFSDRPVTEVLDVVREEEGLWVVGLDFHVAFLSSRGGHVEMCHSSYLGTGAVICEDAATSPAMESRYRVIGPVLGEEVVRRWLQGEPFPTVR